MTERNFHFLIRGRQIPRSLEEMDAELRFIQTRKNQRVLIGRPKNRHEVEPFVDFLRQRGVDVEIVE